MSLNTYLQNKRREIGFSHNFLTIIAMLSMLIDHAALTLIRNGKLYGYDATLYNNAISLPEAKKWIILYTLMRMIGRLAFPIFTFLIVEGFRKTSNLFKYIIRLVILALVSEIPYDLMVFNEFMTNNCLQIQNVVFTYIIGIFLLIILRAIKQLPFIVSIFPVVAALYLAVLFKTDYAVEGIILMYIFYTFRHDLNIKRILTIIVTFLMSLEHYYGAAALSVFFIYFYDGQKGYIDLKRIHYVFYPLHMLILYFIIYISNINN